MRRMLQPISSSCVLAPADRAISCSEHLSVPLTIYLPEAYSRKQACAYEKEDSAEGRQSVPTRSRAASTTSIPPHAVILPERKRVIGRLQRTGARVAQKEGRICDKTCTSSTTAFRRHASKTLTVAFAYPDCIHSLPRLVAQCRPAVGFGGWCGDVPSLPLISRSPLVGVFRYDSIRATSM